MYIQSLEEDSEAGDFAGLRKVSFQWKNSDFLFKNPDFRLKNDDVIMKQGLLLKTINSAPVQDMDIDAIVAMANVSMKSIILSMKCIIFSMKSIILSMKSIIFSMKSIILSMKSIILGVCWTEFDMNFDAGRAPAEGDGV